MQRSRPVVEVHQPVPPGPVRRRYLCCPKFWFVVGLVTCTSALPGRASAGGFGPMLAVSPMNLGVGCINVTEP